MMKRCNDEDTWNVKPCLHQTHVAGYTSIPDEQLVSVYMSTDTSSKQCSTRGYKRVVVSTICRRYRMHVYGDKGYKWILLKYLYPGYMYLV